MLEKVKAGDEEEKAELRKTLAERQARLKELEKELEQKVRSRETSESERESARNRRLTAEAIKSQCIQAQKEKVAKLENQLQKSQRSRNRSVPRRTSKSREVRSGDWRGRDTEESRSERTGDSSKSRGGCTDESDARFEETRPYISSVHTEDDSVGSGNSKGTNATPITIMSAAERRVEMRDDRAAGASKVQCERTIHEANMALHLESANEARIPEIVLPVHGVRLTASGGREGVMGNARGAERGEGRSCTGNARGEGTAGNRRRNSEDDGAEGPPLPCAGSSTAHGSDPEFCAKCGFGLTPNVRLCGICGWGRFKRWPPSDMTESSSSEGTTSDETAASGNSGKKKKPKTNICPKCSLANSKSRLFCGKCGTSLGGAGVKGKMKPIDEESVVKDDVDEGTKNTGASGSAGPGATSNATAVTEQSASAGTKTSAGVGKTHATGNHEPNHAKVSSAGDNPGATQARVLGEGAGQAQGYNGAPVMGTVVPPQGHVGATTPAQEDKRVPIAGSGCYSGCGVGGPMPQAGGLHGHTGGVPFAPGGWSPANSEARAGFASCPEAAFGEPRCGERSSGQDQGHKCRENGHGMTAGTVPGTQEQRSDQGRASTESGFDHNGNGPGAQAGMCGQNIGAGTAHMGQAPWGGAPPTGGVPFPGVYAAQGFVPPYMAYGARCGPYMGFPGAGPPIPPRGNHYKGRDLTFEGIPTSGDKFMMWKIQVQTDVVRAANMTVPAVAQEYIALAFNSKATEEQLRSVPEELLQLDALVASQIMKGMNDLSAQAKSGDDAACASFLMTKLNELQAEIANINAKRIVGRQWVHKIALHFKQFAAVESRRAKRELSETRCASRDDMGQTLMTYDRLSLLFCGLTDTEKVEILVKMFSGIPEANAMFVQEHMNVVQVNKCRSLQLETHFRALSMRLRKELGWKVL